MKLFALFSGDGLVMLQTLKFRGTQILCYIRDFDKYHCHKIVKLDD